MDAHQHSYSRARKPRKLDVAMNTTSVVVFGAASAFSVRQETTRKASRRVRRQNRRHEVTTGFGVALSEAMWSDIWSPETLTGHEQVCGLPLLEKKILHE